ncbi:hypothetical protein GCM10017044_20230 [Kordiimonas sediminis]|uniref:Uncharacterized protein n=1 Tax=Kordiimonas sediminis TaxID=1735581 RepID=A0A919AVN5_9PROT|nr:hypothetical protein GCM10017044_20230 [Kordiimonas sediminis]
MPQTGSDKTIKINNSFSCLNLVKVAMMKRKGKMVYVVYFIKSHTIDSILGLKKIPVN